MGFFTVERWFLTRFPIQSLTEYLDKRFQGMFDKRNSQHFFFIYDSKPPLAANLLCQKRSETISGDAIQRELRAIYISKHEREFRLDKNHGNSKIT